MLQKLIIVRVCDMSAYCNMNIYSVIDYFSKYHAQICIEVTDRDSEQFYNTFLY
jgi:hypothetical protein